MQPLQRKDLELEQLTWKQFHEVFLNKNTDK